MSKHLGDYDASTVIYGKFSTFRPSTGAAYTLGGTPALSVYKDASTTQSTTGVTLTADFDSVTGLNHFAIDTSADGTFYAAGSFFDIVITTGTVDSVSVVGSVVASFTIRKDSSLKPTTAARTLDVSAGGEAGVDWANVGSPTTALALTGTTIATTQKVDVETIKTQAVTAAAGVTFPTSIASPTNITAGTITTVTNLTNAPSAGDFTATMKTSIGTAVAASAVASVTGAVGSVTGLTNATIADAVWDEILSGHAVSGSTGEALSAAGGAGDPWITALPGSYSAGQAGYILGTNLNATVSSRSTYAGGDTSGTTTLLSRLTSTRAGYLDNLSGGAVALASSILDAAGLRSALGLASANLDTQLGDLPTANENADALLGRNVAGGSSSGRTVKEALYFLRNKWTIAGGTLTVYATDDSTSAWTGAVTQTAGDPASAIDPT